MKSKIKRQKLKIKNGVPGSSVHPQAGTRFLIFDFCLLPFDLLFSANGTFSLQLLVLLVPVFFGLMGFAVDLGRLYLIKGELNQAASAMALAAASQLTGASGATSNATTAANELLDDTTSHASRYNFGADLIGQTTGLLNSTVNAPSFFDTYADALGTGTAGASTNQAGDNSARHVQITLSADAPLLFWGVLSVGQGRTTPIGAIATAGISAPVCMACDIEPMAVQAVDSTDDTEFGFVYGSYYTLYYDCNASAANPAPQALTGTAIPYILIDHFDSNNTLANEAVQLYAAGANGLLASPFGNTNLAPVGNPVSCITINSIDSIWGSNSLGNTNASPGTCGTAPPTVVTEFLCGMYTRLDLAQSPPGGCTSDSNYDAGGLSISFPPDTDVSDPGGDYTAYQGNGRRIITVPIVDAFGTLTILGFRQFLVIPDPDGSGNLNPSDASGRFVVMYMGMSSDIGGADANTTPAPIKQGAIGCPTATGAPGYTIQGPGKVVLHQ